MSALAELDTAPQTIEPVVNYIVNDGTKLFNYTGGPGSTEVKTGGTPDPHKVACTTPGLTSANSSSTWTASASSRHDTKMKNFFDADEIRRVYYPEMEELIKAESGAKRVVVFDHTLRTADDALREEQQNPRGRCAAPTTTTPNGPARSGVRDILPDEAEELLKRRFAIIQVWRPIRHPVETHPLAICRRPQRLVRRLRACRSAAIRTAIGQTYAIAYNPEAQVVLVAAPGARRGAGVQGLRLGEGRPRPLDRAHRLRRSDHAAERAAAREHRNPHAGVFLRARRRSGGVDLLRRSVGCTSKLRNCPRRSTSTFTARPMRSALSSRIRSSTPVTGSPSSRTTMSSDIRPATSAGPSGSQRRDHRAERIVDPGRARVPARHRHGLRGDADEGAAHAAVLDDLAQHELRGVAGDRKADALRAGR